MIPYMLNKTGFPYAETIDIDGRNFFKISDTLMGHTITAMSTAINENNADLTSLQTSSVAEMISRMERYNFPPNYDFLSNFLERMIKGESYTGPIKNPFVMYIFEFNEQLDQEDLANIWQGLMPKCAKTATLDSKIIEHPLDAFNFFEGKEIPATIDPFSDDYVHTNVYDDSENIRWLVFKVKRKAKLDYYAITPGDDNPPDHERFMPEYSYNWPYDYFSLVEMTRVKGGIKISGEQEPVPAADKGKGLQFFTKSESGLSTEDDTTQTEIGPLAKERLQSDMTKVKDELAKVKSDLDKVKSESDKVKTKKELKVIEPLMGKTRRVK